MYLSMFFLKCILWLWYWFFANLVCIQPIKPVLGPFFMVWRDLHAFYFSTRSGSKIEKQVLIFKGWRKRNHKTKGEAVFLSDLQTSGSEKQRGSCSACAAVSFPNTATRIWSLRRDFQEMQMVLKRKRSRDMPSIMSVKSTKNARTLVIKWVLLRLWTRVYSESHTMGKQISKRMNCVQFFLAANLVCTEAMADEKIELILQSHELRGVPVGSTHQNLQRFNPLICSHHF